jgi:hypothetical protein
MAVNWILYLHIGKRRTDVRPEFRCGLSGQKHRADRVSGSRGAKAGLPITAPEFGAEGDRW